MAENYIVTKAKKAISGYRFNQDVFEKTMNYFEKTNGLNYKLFSKIYKMNLQSSEAHENSKSSMKTLEETLAHFN